MLPEYYLSKAYDVCFPLYGTTDEFISYVGVQASEELLWELFVQAGPVGMSLLLC